jgi:predicted DNA-binding protein
VKETIKEKRRKITMGRMRENPRYNVISMRVSDEEREHLESLMNKTHKSVSDIMREAMDYFTDHYEQSAANRKVA